MNQQFLDFCAKHETALSDLRAYALNDQRDADRLNPVIHAKTMADMMRAAPNLGQYLACSAFIDELYHALITSVVAAPDADVPDDLCDDGTGNGNHIKLVAGDPETGANLALIEAAPELLAALLELVERSKENPMEAIGIGLMAVKARTLIAKVTGQSSDTTQT